MAASAVASTRRPKFGMQAAAEQGWILGLTIMQFCLLNAKIKIQKDVHMLNLDSHPTGKHFLQIPGPSPVPDRILRAMSLPTTARRGPVFGALGLKVLSVIKHIYKPRH